MSSRVGVPFASVVIPVYNEEKVIGSCLSSLKNQEYPQDRYEVIVVDDGSVDNTSEIVKNSGFKCIRQAKQGPAAARNTGLKHAKGDIILFTDADCIPANDWIRQMVQPFNDPCVMGVKGVYLTRQKKIVARFAQAEFEERYRKLGKSSRIDFVDTYSGGFRKNTLLDIGGFNQDFPVANNEDVELSYRLAQAGYKMVFNPGARVYHTHPDKLYRYLSLKFARAYWRMVVYRKFPDKVVRDSYTPQRLKLEILLSWLICFLAPIALLFHRVALLEAVMVVIFLALISPFVYWNIGSNTRMAIISPLITFMRSIVMGFGVFVGVIGQRKGSSLIPILFLFSDVLACVNAYLLSLWLRTEFLKNSLPQFDHGVTTYLSFLPLVVVLWIVVFASSRLYRPRRSVTNFGEIITLVKVISMGVVIIMAASYALKYDYSRSFVLLYWVCNIVFTVVGRLFIRMIQRNLLRSGFNIRKVIVIGTGELGKMVLQNIISTPDLGLRVVGIVDESAKGKNIRDIPYLGVISNLEKILSSHPVDEVLIAKPSMDHGSVLNLIAKCERANVSFKIVSDLFEIITSRVELDGIGNIPVVDLREGRISPVNAFIKRILDIVLATVLLVISLPFWLAITVLIIRESRGPVLFKQKRVGYKGKEFTIYKFRTMYKNTNSFQIAPTDSSDERVTRIGRFLRRTSLDELPQLINVIKGEMSMVGPRPEMPFIVEKYDLWQRKRLEVKPGITGLWQILGRKELPLHENLEFDFFYIKNQSLFLDLTILLKTVPLVITGKGAF